MKVKVTAEHIKNGQSGNVEKCPVALALKDAGLMSFWVGYTHVYCWKDDGKWTGARESSGTSRLPEEAENFIHAFDSKQDVQPFEFIIGIDPSGAKSEEATTNS